MDNRNEGFYATSDEKSSNELGDVIEKLEALLKETKDKAKEEMSSEKRRELSRVIRENVDKTTEAFRQARDQARVKMHQTTDAIKHVKEKYDQADPVKQKMIIVGLAAAVASLVTAIGIASCFLGKNNDK